MESIATPPPPSAMPVMWATEDTTTESVPRTYRWTRAEYEQLARQGFFQGRRVERIDGEIIEMSPIGDRHIACVMLADDTLRHAFGPGYSFSVQNSFAANENSDPEPDIAVVRGTIREAIAAPLTPQVIVLIVEVSDTTLSYDRTIKASLYASVGLSDYWVLCVQEKRSFLEVRRRPRPDADARFGWAYDEVTVYRAGDTVSPLARPEVVIQVNDLLL